MEKKGIGIMNILAQMSDAHLVIVAIIISTIIVMVVLKIIGWGKMKKLLKLEDVSKSISTFISIISTKFSGKEDFEKGTGENLAEKLKTFFRKFGWVWAILLLLGILFLGDDIYVVASFLMKTVLFAKNHFLLFFLLVIIVTFAISVGIWFLAKKHWVFTMVEENTAQAKEVNKAFQGFYLSSFNNIFACMDETTYHCNEDVELNNKEPIETHLEKVNKERQDARLKEVTKIHHPWDIVPNVRNIDINKPLIPLLNFSKGIKFIGFPPFSQIRKYRFRWTSIEEKKDEKTGVITKTLVPDEEDELQYISLQKDVYAVTISNVEISDRIPLNISLAVTLAVVNPYKALYETIKWLEVVETQIAGKAKLFLGTISYKQLVEAGVGYKADETRKEQEMFLSNENLEFIFDTLLKEVGVKVFRVQILEANPASDLATQFIEASTRKYVAEQQAKAHIAEAEGLKALQDVEGAINLQKWKHIENSNLTVYTESGGTGPQNTVIAADVTKEKKENNTDKKE